MAEQVSYKGYAQATGFRPIQVSNANVAAIAREGERVIRGMEQQRQADIQNRTRYLESLRYGQQLEKQARERNQRLRQESRTAIEQQRRTNFELETRAAEINANNQQQMFKNLASLSTTAYKLADDLVQQKFDRDYEQSLIDTLMTGGDPEAQMAWDSAKNQLQQAGEAIETQADMLAAKGVSETEVEKVRSLNRAQKMGRDHAMSILAGQRWGDWVQNKLETDTETIISIKREDGTVEEITPIEATTSAEKAAVLNALVIPYIKENGLYGASTQFLYGMLSKVNTTNEAIISETRQAEVKAAKERRVTEARDSFADTKSGEMFMDAFRVLTRAYGGDRGAARKDLFNIMFLAKDESGNSLFSDTEIQAILDLTFPGQNKTIGDQYSLEIGELRDARRDSENKHFSQTEAAKKREFSILNDKLREELNANLLDLTDNDLDQLHEKAVRDGNTEAQKLIADYRQFTNEYKNDKEKEELWASKKIQGTLTLAEVQAAIGTVSNELLAKWLPIAQKAQADAVPPAIQKTASETIKAIVQSKVQYDFLNRKGDLSVPLAVQAAEAMFQQEFVKGMSLYQNQGKAQEYALGVVRENFDNPNGLFAVTDSTKGGKVGGPARTWFKNFDIKRQIPTIDNLRQTVNENGGSNALSTVSLIDPSILDNTVKRYKATNRVEIPQRAQDLANMFGGQISALDVLNAQIKFHSTDPAYKHLEQIPMEALKAAQDAINPDFQFFTNYQPNPIRTDIALIGSGMPNMYTNPQITNEQRAALNVLAKYESGAAGYNAVNQIGIKGGRGVLGFSGDFRKMKQHGGRPLTDMTVGEIMNLQANNKMSNEEWIASGRLHAVGRYQFIGPTLAAWVKRLGISPEAKFTPEVQDALALAYMKSAGIGPWVGPSDYATAEERAIIERARTQNLSFGPGQWRQASNMNPNVVSRVSGN